MLKISIIIPCFNEEENIKNCLRSIPADGQTQIIVVDDGSTDRTEQEARESGLANLKVIRYAKRLGKGAALSAGLLQAQAEVAVILDADCTCPAAEIPQLVRPILEGRADLVTGTRFVYPMEPGAMKKSHYLANKISARIISFFIGQRISDSLCGLKAFKKEMLAGKLKEKSWPDFELFALAKKSRMRIAEVPVHYLSRKAGISKMKTLAGCFHMPVLLIRSLLSK